MQTSDPNPNRPCPKLKSPVSIAGQSINLGHSACGNWVCRNNVVILNVPSFTTMLLMIIKQGLIGYDQDRDKSKKYCVQLRFSIFLRFSGKSTMFNQTKVLHHTQRERNVHVAHILYALNGMRE